MKKSLAVFIVVPFLFLTFVTADACIMSRSKSIYPYSGRPWAMEGWMAYSKPSDDGKGNIFHAICSQCHNWNIVVTSRKKDWEATVSKMQNYGARMNKEQRRFIIDYPNENYRLTTSYVR